MSHGRSAVYWGCTTRTTKARSGTTARSVSRLSRPRTIGDWYRHDTPHSEVAYLYFKKQEKSLFINNLSATPFDHRPLEIGTGTTHRTLKMVSLSRLELTFKLEQMGYLVNLSGCKCNHSFPKLAKKFHSPTKNGTGTSSQDGLAVVSHSFNAFSSNCHW